VVVALGPLPIALREACALLSHQSEGSDQEVQKCHRSG
jgi:hypothetical protein